MKIVLWMVVGLLSFFGPKARSEHSFLEEQLARDDYLFRVPRTREIKMVQEAGRILLQGKFILHIHATTSAVIFPDKGAVEASLFRNGEQMGVCLVSYHSPTVAEVVGGDIIFQKDKVTRLKIKAVFESKCFLPGIYQMHIDVINSRYDNYRKIFIPDKGVQNFWSERLEIK